MLFKRNTKRNMKKISLLALLLVWCTLANAQYIVTKVSGKVKNGAGNPVRPGSNLKSDEQLSWSSVADRLWVVIVGKGEKILSPSPKAAKANNFLSEVIMSSLHQDSRSGSLSGRGEIIEKIPDAFRTAPTSNGKLVMELENKFLFDATTYPQNGVFFLEIDMPGLAPIIRRLKTNRDTLLISYADLVTETVNSFIKYSVGFSNNGRSQLVAIINPYFDQTADLENMTAHTVLAYQGVTISKEAVRDSIYRNIYASLGKPNGILFTNLFNKYWASNGAINSDDTPGGTGLIFNQADFSKIPALSQSVEVTRGELPDNYSLRQYAPPVGNQYQTSSCTAWATAYACRTITYAIQHGYSITNQYDKIQAFTFSPDFVYNQIKSTADCNTGTAIYHALDFMKTRGDVLKTGDFVCGKSYGPDDHSNAQPFKIKDFYPLNGQGVGKEVLIQRMKAAIASKHALPFGMQVGPDFATVGPSGVWYASAVDHQAMAMIKGGQRVAGWGGHAMCIIGYNDNVNGGSFEVMNSWGQYRAEHGFWWISYDDLYEFAQDVYSIADFDIPAPPINIPAPIKQPDPIVIKPVITPPVNVPEVKRDIPSPIAVVIKPRLKGALEFTLLKPGNQFENIPVIRKQVGERGQVVEGDNADGYANFVFSKDMHSGSQYKIKFDLAQSAYVYVVGMDKQSTYMLFPQKKLNESALINVNNATLYLPNSEAHYTLDNVTGKERMCILVSKSPIDIDALNQQFTASNNNLYQAVRKNLSGRLLEMKMVAFTAEKIGFDTPVNDNHVLAFFVEMNHLD
jgi:C1A family cysteine protease